MNKNGGYLGIDTNVFEQQIEYLSGNFNLISLKDFFKILNRQIIVKKPLLITFDDGYLDNYTDAYPILKKNTRLLQLYFLQLLFIDNKIWIWHDIYRHIVENTPLKTIDVNLNGNRYKWRFENNLEKRKVRRKYLLPL